MGWSRVGFGEGHGWSYYGNRMNQDPHPDSELHSEAMLLYHSIQIAALEETLTKLGQAMRASIGGKTLDEFLFQQRELNIRNILRHRADIDPTRASRLLDMLLKMNRG